jgi:hypothetical protein
LRPITLAVAVWLAFILLASLCGALMSFYTGKAADLPKWNGWSYLLFSAEEFAMFAAMLTWPISLVVFAVSVIRANRPKRI